MKQYQVEVERDGKYWLVTVPAVDRVTQARSLHEVDAMARDLIAIMDEVAPDSFDLSLVVRLPESVRERLERSRRLREEEALMRAEAASEYREAAQDLRRMGLTVRDIGKTLGISYQRAATLVGNPNHPAARLGNPKHPAKVRSVAAKDKTRAAH